MKKIKIKKKDFDRSLITETLPFETPIIFSTYGLYDLVTNKNNTDPIRKRIIDTLIKSKQKCTIPYHYLIKKDNLEFRRLALLHPNSQLILRDFYKDNESLLINYCNISPTSIRRIKNVATSFYKKNSWKNIHKYKNSYSKLNANDNQSKYSPSYFGYHGHDRLYKFFNSKDYFNLEKKFSHLRTIDISKCFDSIYTHSISWATKNKDYVKNNVEHSYDKNFGDLFDTAIRQGNYNETNGIPIGNEVSRIFAEIILQKIDVNVINKLSNEGLKFNEDFTFRRYVDDIFIFTKNLSDSELIYKTFSNELLAFNLHTNQTKTSILSRPFVTKKSKLISEISFKSNLFFDKFLEINDKSILSPKSIVSTWKLTKNFIDTVKEVCAANSSSYDEASNFLIAIFNERVKKIISIEGPLTPKEIKNYTSAFQIILDVMFFLYTISPSVGASYRLTTSIILITKFSKEHLKHLSESIELKLYELTLNLIDANDNQTKKSFINLELVNIVLAIRSLGSNYKLPIDLIKKVFSLDENISYFIIISALYYLNGDSDFKEIENELIEKAINKILLSDNILISSEITHLALDLIYYPNLEHSKKKKIIRKIIGAKNGTNDEIAEFLKSTNEQQAFTSWKDINLLNALERKELNQAY